MADDDALNERVTDAASCGCAPCRRAAATSSQSATSSTPKSEGLVEELRARSGLAEGPICRKAAYAIEALTAQLEEVRAWFKGYIDGGGKYADEELAKIDATLRTQRSGAV